MIDTKAIRNKILDLAVRGKLTEQLPEDGTAEELYLQIQAEKQALVNAGKIKKEKPLPEINKDEIPFEIPRSWKWVLLGNISSKITSGSTPTGGKKSDVYVRSGFPFFREQNIYDDGIHESGMVFILEELLNSRQNSTVLAMDILLNITGGSIGRCALIPENFDRGSINQHILIIRTIAPQTRFYLHKLICSPFIQSNIKNKAVGDKDGFSAGRCKKMLVPLPPLAEQKRIVEKIEQAFSVLDTIDELQKKYADNMTVLKSKLIDLAIQGKLTEQLPEDGTAEELYHQIQTEKQALIKSGKIKKEKPLPEIDENEIPFEIPNNWKWVRLQEITSNLTLNDGDWVLSDDMVPIGNVKLVQLGSIGDLQYKDKGFKYLTLQRFKELNGKQIFPGYLLINRLVADKMLLCIIPPIDGILMTAVDVCWVAPQEKYYDIKYLMYTLSSSSIQQKVKEVGYGVTRFRISKTNLISIPFPFPPLAEQKRIVVQLEKILKFLEIKEKRL